VTIALTRLIVMQGVIFAFCGKRLAVLDNFYKIKKQVSVFALLFNSF